MDVSGVNSRITKRLCEPPNVRKVDAEHKGGFAIICIVIVRGAVVPPRNLRTGSVEPSLHNQGVQCLGVNDARQTGGIVVPSDRVYGHLLEVYICLNTGESYIA